jgi:hypothetical protein
MSGTQELFSSIEKLSAKTYEEMLPRGFDLARAAVHIDPDHPGCEMKRVYLFGLADKIIESAYLPTVAEDINKTGKSVVVDVQGVDAKNAISELIANTMAKTIDLKQFDDLAYTDKLMYPNITVGLKAALAFLDEFPGVDFTLPRTLVGAMVSVDVNKLSRVVLAAGALASESASMPFETHAAPLLKLLYDIKYGSIAGAIDKKRAAELAEALRPGITVLRETLGGDRPLDARLN